jgi:hypothetical protein
MPPPLKRYDVARLSRATVNGEMVNHGVLVWLRDKASVDLLVEAIAWKYDYNELDPRFMDTNPVRINQMSKPDFVSAVLSRILRDAIIDYRRANAETASVTAELPELPDVS